MKKLTRAISLVGLATEVADLQYASGFRTVDPVVFVAYRERGYLVVPAMEAGRARREVKKGVQVLTPHDLGLAAADRARISSWLLRLLKKLRVKRVTVPPTFPIGVASRLRRNGIRMEVAAGPLFPRRATKSASEVRCMRRVQAAACHAMDAAVRAIRAARVGRGGYLVTGRRRLTAEDVQHVIERALLERGCTGEGTIVACGRQGADPHERGRGPLRAGKAIVIDIFPRDRATGYWGDLTRTIVRGKASQRIREMHAAVKAAQGAALREVRAGAAVRRVHQAAARELERRGFATTLERGEPEGFIHGTGHGVGLEIHEWPRVAAVPGCLKAGSVITIEPGLYYRAVGGMRIEDTVVVTRRGWRCLAAAPEKLEV